MDPIQAIRTFFLLATSTTLLVGFFPPLRNRFLPYGSRAVKPLSEKAEDVSQSSASNPSPYQTSSGNARIDGLLDHLASYRVPHSYFTHFYVISVASSVFWCAQILLGRRAFRGVVSFASGTKNGSSMSPEKVALAWLLMIIQGLRRLYESTALTKPSHAQMWIGHWLIGIAFYLAMNMAVWVEGIPALASSDISLASLAISAPSLRTMCCIPLFLIASGIQHDCHKYLASLRKYTLPAHPAFQRVICPHYTAECMIYLSMALIAAPVGEVVNKTILMSLVFVIVNLGITATMTKGWYQEKFGKEMVSRRWRMIPFVL